MANFIFAILDRIFDQLEESGCIERGVEREGDWPGAASKTILKSTSLGSIASRFYLKFKTVRTVSQCYIKEDAGDSSDAIERFVLETM